MMTFNNNNNNTACDFNIIHKLQNFVPPFTLYLDAENAPNPGRIHFEKTNRSRSLTKTLLSFKTLLLT